MTRVAVNPQLLSWALERSGRAAAVQDKFPQLPKWLQGVSRSCALVTFAKQRTGAE
jgi:hypothetical protein